MRPSSLIALANRVPNYCQKVERLLLVFRLLPRGFANRELREQWAPLRGKDPSERTQGRMTYQLRRLRLHGLIVRLPGSHRYEVTQRGLRIALFFSRSYAWVVRPGLAELSDTAATSDTPLRGAAEQFEAAMIDLSRSGFRLGHCHRPPPGDAVTLTSP